MQMFNKCVSPQGAEVNLLRMDFVVRKSLKNKNRVIMENAQLPIALESVYSTLVEKL